MKITDFNLGFPDEHSCRMELKSKREKEGIVCRQCVDTKHYWISSIYQWSCARCQFRTTLRRGTVMYDSNLTRRVWYLCMAFMGMSKKTTSDHEMRRQLGMKQYTPVCAIMKKIRNVMRQRDQRYGLSDMVELD